MLMHPRYKLTEAEGSLYQSNAARKSSGPDHLQNAIEAASRALRADQQPDGHWNYQLEADCTIPAEYIMWMHFMDEVDAELERKIAVYLRGHQAEHGGWPLYPGGAFDLSCSVKVYFALKLVGEDVDAPHMVRAREAILAHGGAAQCNVFTRIALALFGQVPWRAVPFIPAEVILLPRWFPFHIGKVASWSRTVMVPLFVLCTLKPKAANPRGVQIRELFTTPPEKERHYFHPKSPLQRIFLLLDKMGRGLERLVPTFVRRKALRACEQWFIARLNGIDGLNGIFPAMVNAHESLALLGYPADHPLRVQARDAIRNLVVEHDEWAYCQPCLSPVWDTAIACHALHEVGEPLAEKAALDGLEWLRERQLTDEPADWREYRPEVRGGGWPFQYTNPYYPDLDDTSMVGWAMHQVDPERFRNSIGQAAEWIWGMRSANGGYGAYDADNTDYYLNAIPFADHGALLDPPTSDVTGRCLALLALAGDDPKFAKARDEAIRFLMEDQESDGAWFGRWGTNYVYGTWSVLAALEVAGEDPGQPYIQRAVGWLKRVQNSDGGWGESNDSYFAKMRGQTFRSTPYQTAWGVLGLIAAGEVDSEEVRLGVDYLLRAQQEDGLWDDDSFTAPGFPRVFYLKYHGYAKYFPLWALARYRNLTTRPRR